MEHRVYQEIEEMKKFYNCLSDTCFFFIPTGAPGAANYASYIYWSLRGTLDSIATLLRASR